MNDIVRKMATIKVIQELTPIKGADRIELARIGGWKVVVQKDLHKIGDKVVYFEIDSFIPDELAPFLSHGRTIKEFNGVVGQVLKTATLRKVLSQGLIMPLSVLPDASYEVGQDVSDILGIQLYEPPIPDELLKYVKGSKPSLIKTPDEERIQNLEHLMEEYSQGDLLWQVTEKLEGMALIVYQLNEEIGASSKRWDYTYDEDYFVWKLVDELSIKEKIKQTFGNRNIALMGELIGGKIQGNHYNLNSKEFHIYNIYDIDNSCYLNPTYCASTVQEMGLKYVPVISYDFSLKGKTIDDLLTMADGKSQLADVMREGIVLKRLNDPTNYHFKVISNNFLLKEDKEDETIS